MSARWAVNLAAAVNLLVPGAGLILTGATWVGLATGLVFIICANAALWITLLIPDEVSRWSQALAIGVAGGAYLGAQMRFAQSVRSRERNHQAARRREALSAARTHLKTGNHAAALAALEPVRDGAEHDLLLAYRTAQACTGMRDAETARAAWQRVRALDRHHIYSEQIRAGEQAVERLRAAGA